MDKKSPQMRKLQTTMTFLARDQEQAFATGWGYKAKNRNHIMPEASRTSKGPIVDKKNDLFLSCKRMDLQVQLQGNVQLGRVWSARAGSGQSARAGSGWVEIVQQE